MNVEQAEAPAGRAAVDAGPGGARRDARAALWLRLLMLGIWAALVLLLAWHHVPWRDEVRAFSIALQGDDLIDMLRGLQGEGHPALWYLLLRGAYALVPVNQVLLAVALLVAATGMVVLVLRAPLRTGTIALFMFGGLGLFEYTVSARNYGIGMTLLFVIAALYPRCRDRGVVMGLLLALLCNTSVPATFLAAALVGFWLIELVAEEGLRWSRKYLLWMVNAAVAAAGALVCFLTVFPTVHDAASIDHPGGIGLAEVLHALALPARAFPDLGAPGLFGMPLSAIVFTLLLGGSLVGLVRAPAAFLAGLGVLLFFQLFYQLVYPGGYRHQGLLIVFLLTLYWLVAEGRGGRWPGHWRPSNRFLLALGAVGQPMFALLLALQLWVSAIYLAAAVQGVPYSRAADLAALIEREGLGNAVLIADPDVMLEPLPYYVGNSIWLHREQRFGKVVRFTANARLDIRLDDILADARRLAAATGRPVVMVLRHELDPNAPAKVVPEPYVGTFTTDPDQVRRFLAATRRLGEFWPALTDEVYRVYLLTDGGSG